EGQAGGIDLDDAGRLGQQVVHHRAELRRRVQIELSRELDDRLGPFPAAGDDDRLLRIAHWRALRAARGERSLIRSTGSLMEGLPSAHSSLTDSISGRAARWDTQRRTSWGGPLTELTSTIRPSSLRTHIGR